MASLPPLSHADGPDGGEFSFNEQGADGFSVRLGEMTYSRVDASTILVHHTAVDPRLRGTGAARVLLDALVAFARERGLGVQATCSYARGQFEKDQSLSDVYRPLTHPA